MLNLKTVLWATDGSKTSEHALKYAKILIQESGARTVGVHVIRDISKRIFDIMNLKIDFDEITQDERQKFIRLFEKQMKEFCKAKLKFEYDIEIGGVEERVFSLADKYKADLIVLGHSGATQKDTLLYGSNTNKIVRSSNVPVLVADKPAKRRITKIKKIMVPLNLTEEIDSAVDYAVMLASELTAELSVLYVQEFVSYAYETPIIVLDDVRSYFEKKLGNLIKKYSKSGVKISANVSEHVSPYVGIMRHCEQIRPDLIVMNTHQRKGLKKYFMGSVAEKIIHDLPCPVITFKP